MNLYQHAKNQLIPSLHSWDAVNFRIQKPDWPYHFLTTVSFRVQKPDWSYQFFTMLNQKTFNQLLIFVNLYQHAKNETVSSIYSGEIFDLKILQSDWLRDFGLYLRNKIFSKYRICTGTQQTIKNLIIEQIQ